MMLVAASISSLRIVPARLVLMKIPEGYTFELVDSQGEKRVAGTRFNSAVSCIRAMMRLKDCADSKKCFRKCISGDNRYFFVVLNAQAELIASSDLYMTAAQRDHALLSMERELPFAEMVEG